MGKNKPNSMGKQIYFSSVSTVNEVVKSDIICFVLRCLHNESNQDLSHARFLQINSVYFEHEQHITPVIS